MAPDAEQINDWGNSLKDLTDTQLMGGVKNAERHVGFFSLPVFRLLCEQCSKYPAEREAYLEAVNHSHEWKTYTFSHDVVLAALKMSNVTAMRSMAERYSSKIYARNYAVACRKHAAGLPLDVEVPLALPEKIEHRLTPTEQKTRFKELRAKTGL